MDQAVEQPRRKAFPPRSALVNPIAQNAYAMRFLREEKISSVGPNTGVQGRGAIDVMNTRLRAGSENLLHLVTHCYVADAMLVRRPYARILDGDPETTGVLRFKIDGEIVAEGAIAGFLVKDMQDPVLDEPFKWMKTQNLFISGRLEIRSQSEADKESQEAADFRKGWKAMNLPPLPGGGGPDAPPSLEVAVMDDPPSIFAPNGSFIEISALDVDVAQGKAVQIEVGLLAATYTTRDVGANPRTLKARP